MRTRNPVVELAARHAREASSAALATLSDIIVAEKDLPRSAMIKLRAAQGEAAESVILAAKVEIMLLGDAPESAEAVEGITSAERETMRRAGVNLDVDYTGVADGNEAAARLEASKPRRALRAVAADVDPITAEAIEGIRRLEQGRKPEGMYSLGVDFAGVANEAEARSRFEASRRK
jgi:hypothetical protein